ncbi:MAG: hypothetical protein AB1782_11785 [Cyanobacteriota bacterium]
MIEIQINEAYIENLEENNNVEELLYLLDQVNSNEIKALIIDALRKLNDSNSVNKLKTVLKSEIYSEIRMFIAETIEEISTKT